MQIPTSLQFAQTREELTRFASDLFNWAVYCPGYNLQNYIRAINMNLVFDAREGTQLSGLTAFVHECMYKSPGKSVSVKDVHTSYVNWLQQQGENTKSAEKMKLNFLGNSLTDIIKNTYNYIAPVQRPYLIKDDKMVRPSCLMNIQVTDGRVRVGDDIEPSLRFTVSVSGEIKQLPGPLDTDGRVAWLKTSNLLNMSFDDVQSQILDQRKKAPFLLEEAAASIKDNKSSDK